LDNIMATFRHRASHHRTGFQRRFLIEQLEDRQLLTAVTLDPNTVFQTVQGFGTAAVYPTNLVTIAQAGAIMRDAGMNVVRVTPSANDYTYTVGGSMSTPVPISANLDENVARFNPGENSQVDLIDWLQVNGLQPDRIKMIGALWSPPHWMKITTGTLISWNGGANSGYDPVLPWGDYGANTGAGRVNPDMWTDWARYVLSTVESWEQKTGLTMYAFSFQNEPNVPTSYNSCTFDNIANDVNNPSAGSTGGHWDIYGDAVQALANELALHPEITTKFFGPELSQLGGGSSLTSCNPYNLGNYNAVRQNLISRGLLDDLDGWATHEYTYASGGDAALWDAWYNGSAHAALIVSGGTSNYLDWLGPTPGIAGDNKEIWQTETEGEDQTWTKDGAMSFGLKIQNALVYGHVSGYTSWTLTGYSSSDTWGLVDLDDINNPTNSYKYDAMKQFSRYVNPGAQRINAVFENGKASIGGANELDTYNGLTVSAFNQAEDKRLTMVFTNMETSSQSTTITIPAGLNVASFQVFVTSGTQKFVQLADLTPSGGQISITIPASSFVTITGLYGTPDPNAPDAPTGLSGTVVTNRRIDLSWTDNASNETAFFMERATNSGFTQNLAITTLSTNATSYQDTTVVPSTTYYYRVRAYNAAGYSAYSNVVNYTTTAAALPAAPTNLSGTVVSSSRINLSWTDNASNESSFYIERATNSAFTQNLVINSVGSNVTSYQDTGLSASTRYYYRVRASNIDGYSAYSNVVNYTTLASTSIFTGNQDIGSFTPAGSYSENSGIYTVNGAGSDIWGTADQFQFAYLSLTGNGTITARIDSMQNTDAWAKAGVMFRNTLTAGSIHALMAITPGNGAAFQYRSSTNGSSTNNNVTGYTAPYWVRITRSSNSFTGYRSADGVTWTQVGSTTTLAMGSTVYVGLAVSSHSSGNLCTSVFSNVSVTTPPTVTINQAGSQVDPTHSSPINYTVVFSESVSDFATGDVTLSGTAGATTAVVTGSGKTYNVAVSGMTSNGTVIARLLAGVAHDASVNASTASTSTDNTVTYDATSPTVTIDQASGQADPANASPINFTVVFSESVSDFATGDVTLSGTAGATSALVTGSGTTYNVAVSGMNSDGTVIANLLSGVAHDTAGNLSEASTSTDNIVTLTTPTHTWNGGSTVNNLWKTPENWDGDVAPNSGDDLIFPAGAKQLENVNNYPSITVFGSITVTGSGYLFQNGGVPTTSVQVMPGVQFGSDKITTGTLTVGAGSVVTICANPSGPLAEAMISIVDAVSETSASDPPATPISPQASNPETIQALQSVEPSQPLVAAIEETPTASLTSDTQDNNAKFLPEQAPGLNNEYDIICTTVNSTQIGKPVEPSQALVAAIEETPLVRSTNSQAPLAPPTSSQIRDFLFSQPQKEDLLPTAFSDLAKNDSPGKSSGVGSGKMSKASLAFDNTLRQYHCASQAIFFITAARDATLRQTSHDDWLTDWLWNDDLEKTKKRQNADSHQAMPLVLDSILLQ